MNRILCIVALAGLLGSGMIPSPSRADLIAALQDFSSIRAYPNPWRVDRDGSVPMVFDHLPDGTVSTLRIYTIAGEHVRTLSGTAQVAWDLRNASGQRVASGVYLFVVSSPNDQKTGKVVVIR